MSNWPRLLAALAAAALAGFAVFAFVVVMGYGVMWLFIYGDSTWPPGADDFAHYGLPTLGLMAGLIVGFQMFQAIRSRASD
jgi:hypothetical protein